MKGGCERKNAKGRKQRKERKEGREIMGVVVVEWRGRSYLVADDGTLFDDAHAAVGRWPDHATAGSAPVWAE